MLEEGSFRGRTADFVFMFLFGGVLMTVSFARGPWARQGASLQPRMRLSGRPVLSPGCLG